MESSSDRTNPMSTTTTLSSFVSTGSSNTSRTLWPFTDYSDIYTTDEDVNGTLDTTIDRGILSTVTQINQLSQQWTDIIHSVAVASLAISILFSVGTVSYLFLSDRGRSFWTRKIAERLVVYLALCDLFYSTEHIVDHTYILIHDDFPPENMCIVLGFLLQEFSVLQGILVVFTALNAFSLVVREKGIVLGRCDWRLISAFIGVPTVMGVILASMGMLGPSEAWCFTDKRKEAAAYVDMIYALSFVAIFIIDIACYGLVWYKIQKVSGLVNTYKKDGPTSDSTGGRRNLTAARTMCIFIVAYIGQWFGYMAYSVWSLVQSPPVELLALTVVVTNMGGVFNCIAYTWVRKRNKQTAQNETSSSNRQSVRTAQNETSSSNRQSAQTAQNGTSSPNRQSVRTAQNETSISNRQSALSTYVSHEGVHLPVPLVTCILGMPRIPSVFCA